MQKYGGGIYLISLQKDSRRRELLKAQFASFNNFNLVDAVNGKELSLDEYYELAYRSFYAYNQFLSPSEMGCALSHQRALKQFLDSKYEWGLIFEDDVTGSDDDIKKAFDIAKKLPKNSLLHCFKIKNIHSRVFGRYRQFGTKVFELDKFSFRQISGATAYVVSRDSAKILLNQYQNAPCIADFFEPLCFNGVRLFYYPIFGLNDEGISNITAERSAKDRVNKFNVKDVRFYSLRRNFAKYIISDKLNPVK